MVLSSSFCLFVIGFAFLFGLGLMLAGLSALLFIGISSFLFCLMVITLGFYCLGGFDLFAWLVCCLLGVVCCLCLFSGGFV